MTVKLRLMFAFSILIIMSVILGAVSLQQIGKINDALNLVVNDRMPKVTTLMEIDQRRVSLERDIGQLIQARSRASENQALRRINHRLQADDKAYKFLNDTLISGTSLALLKKANQAHQAQLKNLNRIIKLTQSGQSRMANRLFLSSNTRQLSTTYRNAIRELTDYQKTQSDQASHAGSQFGKQATTITIIVLVLSIAVGMAFFIWIMRVVVRPVISMQKAMQEVVDTGEFDKQVKVESRDEIGLSVEALNRLLQNMQNAISDANTTIGALAEGDFSKRVTRDYVGDLDTLKQGVNTSADNVTKIMGELNRVMQSLHDGQFDVEVNTAAKGEYRAMLVTTSEAMHAINQVVNDINQVMAAMQNGRFQERVTAESRGELDLMKQRINNSMEDLDSAMTEIIRVVVAQSEGDLTHHIDAQYQGDLETLKQAVNTSADKLVSVIAKAMEASRIVSGAAQEVSKGSADLSQRVQEQAAALEQTSSTMDEMNSAVEANTENSQRAAEVAQAVQAQSNEGSEVMQQTIDAMNEIQESSYKISDIVTLIDGIAFQTNLLALNAAVEAARAGEHGRGFAVVAGEVRALAQKSAEAAKDIKALIDESVTRIEQGTGLAAKSGEMLTAINQSIHSVTEMVEQIANASAEQANGVGQVNVAITQIDQVTQQNAALVEETTAAAESMNDQSTILLKDMSFFNTGRVIEHSSKELNLIEHHQTDAEAQKTADGKESEPEDSGKEPLKLEVKTPEKKQDPSDQWSEF
ncbi:MAG: methyl-accepting chemotaxis protein [Hydrogenovibrio sp.]|nr:methyl-accepting chemotaxis protein [Hydrogenovibrio sp.]